MKSFFRKKTIEGVMEEARKKSFKRTLGAFDLVLLGVGCAVGTGVFVLTGVAAAVHAGPAIAISYLLAGIVCIFTGLAYAELASMIPISGSAYTYSYSTLGEFAAWIVACGLILAYMVGASTVAAGWSGYLIGILKAGGITIPEYLTKTPSDGGVINLPAIFIVAFIGILLMRGTKESLMLNRVLVFVKLAIIFLFLVIAVPHIKMENYADFMPFGWNGVINGSAMIFCAYIGFDSVATAAEEAKDPKRDLPIGIIGSLVICIVLYVLIALALTGISPYALLNNPEPVAKALRENGSNIGSVLIAVGAIAGMVAVILALMYGLSRIFFVMSRDGLISAKFSKLHKKYETPYFSCGVVTISIALICGFTPIHTMGSVSSLGALFAFSVVCLGVLILRITRPNLHRPFRCPAIYFIAPAAILTSGYLIYTLLQQTGKIFFGLLIISSIFYLAYGFSHSHLNPSRKN